MSDSSSLSAKQAKVLAFIENEITKYGRPPTYRDIAKGCGYDAVGTVQDHVRALIQKGFLEKEAKRARGIKLAHRSGSMDVPILGTVPAGRPSLAFEDQLGSIAIPSRWRGALYALRVSGESMKDAGILDGDFVIVKKQTHAENGEIVVAMIEGEATVKYLEKKRRKDPTHPRKSEFFTH
jgi:repressor LexA